VGIASTSSLLTLSNNNGNCVNVNVNPNSIVNNIVMQSHQLQNSVGHAILPTNFAYHTQTSAPSGSNGLQPKKNGTGTIKTSKK
jgi:hypothetical protein